MKNLSRNPLDIYCGTQKPEVPYPSESSLMDFESARSAPSIIDAALSKLLETEIRFAISLMGLTLDPSRKFC